LINRESGGGTCTHTVRSWASELLVILPLLKVR
jgi:hypothetical protein